MPSYLGYLIELKGATTTSMHGLGLQYLPLSPVFPGGPSHPKKIKTHKQLFRKGGIKGFGGMFDSHVFKLYAYYRF